MDNDIKINGVDVLGKIKVDGITYYVDMNKTIYTCQDDGAYSKVNDESTLKKILDYITPQSMDVR